MGRSPTDQEANPVSEQDPRRAIPRADALLADPEISAYAEALGGDRVRAMVAAATAQARAGSLAPQLVRERVLEELAALARSATTLTPVLNATGVVIHTNLGRAPLTAAAREALLAASGYVDVEFGLESGVRERRGRGTVDALLAAVPAAQDALVVTNGAAALSLAVTALAQGRDMLVSRGELVEIGDGFRLPDLIESTGVTIREVGTTNRTHLADYAGALDERAAAILKVHPSNFRVSGFTAQATVGECAALGREHGIPVIVDIGSGLLAPDDLLTDEPDAQSTLAAGADLVICSGDKLLGGPQAGLIFGRADLVHRLRRHPLARAFRAGKLTLAALEATLRGPRSRVSAYLHRAPDELRGRVEGVRSAVLAARPDLEDVLAVVPVEGAVGGGGAPGMPLPGWALVLPEHLAGPLRRGSPAIVARVEGGRTLLDLRCIEDAEDPAVASAVLAALGRD